MRKLFFFRASGSSSGNDDLVPEPDDKLYWETPSGGSIDIQVTEKVKDSSQSPKKVLSKPGKQYLESKSSGRSGLRRSLSFSSPGICSHPGERNLNCSSRSPNSGNIPCHMDDYPIRHRSLTPERHPNPKRHDLATVQKTRLVERLDSPSSSRGYVDTSGNSPYGSPVPLKCRPARLTLPNKPLDLYIDGEQHARNLRPKSEPQRNVPSTENGCFAENRVLPKSRRPPRVQSTTAPASPTNDREHMKSSWREARAPCFHLWAGDWGTDDVRPVSPKKLAKSVVERLSHSYVFPQKSKIEPCDFDLETSTIVEDIYEDYSGLPPGSQSNGITQESCLSEQMPSCHLPHTQDKTGNECCTKEVSGFQNPSVFIGDYPFGVKHENSIYSAKKDEGLDELRRKAEEAEERVMLLSEDINHANLENGHFSTSELLQMIGDITDDRRKLAIEVSTQIQSRIAERTSASEALKWAKIDLNMRTRRLEKEKNEIQSALEKELDRRSTDWSFRVEKYQSEEQRLRVRVRELAEQNVSLQREVSLFNSREAETTSRLTHLDMQLNEVTAKMEEMSGENSNLQKTLSEFQGHSKAVEADRDCIKRSYNEKVKENKELQKTVARLHRLCGEQEKTISGLRQGLHDDISRKPLEEGDIVTKMQMEQARLTGMEQMLRREVESCRHEVESLRHENINLLGRLQGNGNGAHSAIKLEQELRARVDCLQNRCLSLLDDNGQLCGKLLEIAKENMCPVPELSGMEQAQKVNNSFDSYSIIEYDMRFQSFMRGVENLRRSLQTISVILQEKADLDASESQLKVNEVDAELELKAEILLTKALREKLCSKELELEQLQAELATSIRGHDILRCEIQMAQDSISCLTHKMKDLELQALRKDENINQLQNNLHECMKELTITKGILPKVSQERDMMWEEVKQYSEKSMLLNHEVSSLKKKIEALEEDILLKEGQITILKDSLVNKPFDILYNPTMPMKEFSLE